MDAALDGTVVAKNAAQHDNGSANWRANFKQLHVN
jgi:hypothetical protein